MFGDKKTQSIPRAELLHLLSVARGESPADLLIKNVQFLDLINGGKSVTSIAIAGSYIAGIGDDYRSDNVIDATNLTIVPGFIDAHLHIESSLMHPFEFERTTLPLGTTTAICDPHEITNVIGMEGLEWFLRCCDLMKQNLFVQVSSCVPAVDGIETNGGILDIDQMLSLRDNPSVLGLAEMMNFPGVINGNDEVLDKLEGFSSMVIDGHSPLLRGKMLNAYLAAGIDNCHETVTFDEGKEKLSKGMSLIMREGTVAKNLDALSPLVSEMNVSQCMLCTDDRNPHEIATEGHINFLIKKLINENGVLPHLAYRMASFSAAKHYRLKRVGLIAPGYRADFVLLKDILKVEISDVFIGGEKVSDLKLDDHVVQKLKDSKPPVKNTIYREHLSIEDFAMEFTAGSYNVIEVIPEEIITNRLQIDFDGSNFASDDVLKISVIERYGKKGRPAIGLVKGMGLKSGAIASSVAHDSHNLIAVGTNDEDMAVAVNALIDCGGGFSIVENGKVKAILELPIAGLMTLEKSEEIEIKLLQLRENFKRQGITLEGPFLQMAFLSLPVIPSLKLTDQGLFDVEHFKFIDLKC